VTRSGEPAPPARTALVVGATGVVGWAVVERLSANPAWRTIGISRRTGGTGSRHESLAIDLFDSSALLAARDRLRAVTHVFGTLRVPAADPAEEAERNLVPLANLMAALEAAGADLRHVCLIHGTKWYGSHRGPYSTPAKERHPRQAPPNYYYAQHDLVTSLQRGRAWAWSTLRPHTVWGRSPGTGNSLVTAIGVYAAICRAAGRPLDFPGPAGTWTKLSQGITAELLAEAMEWVATTPACANQDFNVTNGDSFRWHQLWPRIAEFFSMPVGEVKPARLASTMRGEEDRWRGIARAHGLVDNDLGRLVNWSYLDGLLAPTWDDLSSVTKARRHGFTPAIDSEDAFVACLSALRSARIIP
jgi:nucleoside-diphosphate-sugar epimerase